MRALPHLVSLATETPAHTLRQEDVRSFAKAIFPSRATAIDRLIPVYANAGIETRYSCVPLEWYGEAHDWRDRTALYVAHAVELVERAAMRALDRAGHNPEKIDAVVAVSTSGVTTPSLDALLVERMGLRRNVTRLPIFGLGCGGGVTGLARAADLARARPDSLVLLAVVELCGLTFRRDDYSKSNIIATALFGDGAAAALISCDGDGPALIHSGEYTWPDSLDVMGWRVENDGFGVLFSSDIPSLVSDRFGEALASYLADAAFELGEYDGFVCHPGGAKVIAALEKVFRLEAGTMTEARGVLRDYGNMSAATVLFVLERMAASLDGRYLMSALGPGFTASFLTLEA